jgi:hypothetical protein
MPTCPLCENVQPGGEACDVCGKAFAPGEAIPVPVAPLPDLERTALEAAAGGPDAPTLEALEPTASPAGAVVGTAPVDGLEPTSIGPVAVAAETLPDLEPTLEAPLPPEAPLPGAGTACRYCRTPAVPGQAFCSRCGMRLPAADARREGDTGVEAHACTQCGSPTRQGLCPSCGARVRG